MTEHLPECAVAVALPGTFTSCICEALRACEERVLNAAVQRVAALIDPWPNTSPGLIRRGNVFAAIKGDQP
jgi:hypothetical protein